MSKIQGVLFDSGHTLVYPIAGAWWPGPRFEQLLTEHGIAARPSAQQMEQAVQKGVAYLTANHHLLTEAEEYEQFQNFYGIVLDSLPLPYSSALLNALAADIVYGLELAPYPDVRPALETLRQAGFKLGVISNAWPSLARKYEQLHLREYFSTFVISAQVGCTKPDERIFQVAIGMLHLPPEHILFVDDVPEYVEKAMQLGFSGLVMLREPSAANLNLPFITNLVEIAQYIERFV